MESLKWVKFCIAVQSMDPSSFGIFNKYMCQNSKIGTVVGAVYILKTIQKDQNAHEIIEKAMHLRI